MCVHTFTFIYFPFGFIAKFRNKRISASRFIDGFNDTAKVTIGEQIIIIFFFVLWKYGIVAVVEIKIAQLTKRTQRKPYAVFIQKCMYIYAVTYTFTFYSSLILTFLFWHFN